MFWVILLLVILGLIIGFDVLGYIIIGLIVFGGIYYLATAGDRKKAEEEWKQKIAEQKAANKKAQEEKEAKYKNDRRTFTDKYGEPDKEIIIKELDINQEIMAFGKVHRLVLMGEDLAFCNVLGCTFNDNSHVRKGNITYESKTKTNNGNMLGRAVVGGVLAGGAGAVIGGSTASKNTQTIAKQGNDITIHDYTVVINLNSLKNPIVRIPLGQDGKTVNEIIGLLNVIMQTK